jgi:tetratricopeptide (TPR) repeat protein
MGEDDGALEMLDELAGFAADFRVHRAQGDIYFEKTAWREAAVAYANALLYNGRDVHSIFRQGQAEESSGQPQAAMQAFLLVLELDPGHRQARRRHADLSLQRGSARPAIRGYTSLLSEAPGDASLYFQRAQARMHNRDLMAALHDLTQCIHLDPAHASAYYVRATLLASTDPTRALRDFGIVLLLEDEDSDITTRVYLQRGIVYAACKKAALALADLRACLKQAPPPAAHSVETLYQMGLVHLHLLGRLARAISLFTQALQVDPTCSRALLARAAAYLELDRGDTRAIAKVGKRQLHGGDFITEEQAAAAAAAAHVAREALPLLDGNAAPVSSTENQGDGEAAMKPGAQPSTGTGLAAHLRPQPLPPAPHPRHGLELASRLEGSQGMAERAAVAASEAATAAAVLLPRTRPTRTPLRRALRDYLRLIHLAPLCVEYRLLGGRTALALGESNLAQQLLSAARAIAGAPLGRRPLVQMQADVQLGKTDVAIETLCRRLWPVVASDPATAGALRAVRRPGSLLARLQLAATPGRAQAELMARDRFLQPLVMALVAARRFEEAVAVLEVVVGAGQATAETLLAMGECCTAMGDETLAAEVLTSALRQLPRLAQAWYRRGVARLRLGQVRSAAHDLAKAVELEPTLWQAMLSRATLFALQRRFPKAILNCNEALRLQPRSVRALLMRGCLKALNGTLERALVDLEAAAELDDSRSALITFNRGLVLHRLGRFYEALADYDETLARGATFAPVVRLNRALAHMSLKDYNAAFGDLRALLEVTSSVAPGDEGGRGLAGSSSAAKAARSATPPPTHVLHTMALCCHRGGDVRGAVELYCRALDLDPQFVAGYVGRGNALLDIGTERCWTLCRRDFTRALRCDPLRADAYLNLGIGLQARGQLRRAHRVLSQGIALFPDHAALREARGVVNLQALDVRAAYLDLSAAVHAPGGATATALNTRGVVQLYMHDSVAAMQDFQAAIAADPKDSLPLFNAANVYMAKRQLRQALENYDMAIDLAGGVGSVRLDPSWLVNRALCKAAQGRLQRALADLQLAAQRMGVSLPGNGGNGAAVAQDAEDADLGSGRATEAAKDDVLWNTAVLQLRLAATARKGCNGLAEGLPDVLPRPPTTAEHEAALSAMQAAWRALEVYCGRRPSDTQAEHQRVLAKAEVEAQQQRSENGGV